MTKTMPQQPATSVVRDNVISVGGRLTPTSDELDTLPAGQPGCQPPSPSRGGEMRGTASVGHSIYGLIFKGFPVKTQSDFYATWRITGSGYPSISVIGPSGPVSITDLMTFGPEARGASSYSRPGDEFAAAFAFPQPGCWRISFTRTDMTGDIWLLVT